MPKAPRVKLATAPRRCARIARPRHGVPTKGSAELPPELVNRITSILAADQDIPTLATLMQVSKIWYQSAEPLVYREIDSTLCDISDLVSGMHRRREEEHASRDGVSRKAAALAKVKHVVLDLDDPEKQWVESWVKWLHESIRVGGIWKGLCSIRTLKHHHYGGFTETVTLSMINAAEGKRAISHVAVARRENSRRRPAHKSLFLPQNGLLAAEEIRRILTRTRPAIWCWNCRPLIVFSVIAVLCSVVRCLILLACFQTGSKRYETVATGFSGIMKSGSATERIASKSRVSRPMSQIWPRK